MFNKYIKKIQIDNFFKENSMFEKVVNIKVNNR